MLIVGTFDGHFSSVVRRGWHLWCALFFGMLAVLGIGAAPASASLIRYDLSGDLSNGVPFQYIINANTSQVQHVNGNLVVPALSAILVVGGHPSVQTQIGFLDISSLDVGDILHISPTFSEIAFRSLDLGTYDLVSDLGPISVSEVTSIPVFSDASHLEFSARLVPEPASVTLLGAALLGLAFWRKRKSA